MDRRLVGVLDRPACGIFTDLLRMTPSRLLPSSSYHPPIIHIDQPPIIHIDHPHIKKRREMLAVEPNQAVGWLRGSR